ncbi:MAG TPA: outer membrane beta-barrel protein, partial [Longimicrobium sp.]
MSRRRFTIWAETAAVTALMLGPPAAAQSPGAPRAGTIEIGAFGQWTRFDENAGRPNAVPEDGFGFGGRLGFFLSPRFELEGDGYYSPQDRDISESFCCNGAQPTEVDASGLALRLNYNFPLAARSQFILGAGAVRTNYRFRGGTGVADSSAASFGASGLAGVRFGIANHVAIRLDAVADYMPSHEPDPNLNLHARAGVSLLLGGARPAPLMAPPLPPPPPPPPPSEAPVARAAPARQDVSYCVMQNGRLSSVTVQYDPATGDSTYNGQRVSAAFPQTTGYAGAEPWFVNTEPVTFNGRRYVKYGLPRV